MIGREDERQVLETCLASPRPEFVVVYGRRRVGKTYLVKEYFHNEFSFYGTGVNGLNTRNQLKAFNESLKAYGADEKAVPKDWFEAFGRLRKILEREDVARDFATGKMIVFLDELPWMDTVRSDFKSALDYFWNSWGSSRKDLLFIVCGSATSWIINHIIKDTGGFYNRVTRQIHLMPFCLKECEQLLVSNGMHLTRRQIVESYMIFGGIPYYLNYLRPSLSLAQNVETLFFRDNSPLKDEFYQLFASLFRKSEKYIAIVRVLAARGTGLMRQELLDRNVVSDGKELTKCLIELEQCGFIRKYGGFEDGKNKYLFQLIDSLSLFHFSFLESGKVDSWMDFVGTPQYYNWGGIAFERVCLLHVEQIKKALGISGIRSRAYSWRSRKNSNGAQIDLVIDRKDDVINLCEMKYSREEFGIDSDYEKALVHKEEAFLEETATKKALHLTMVTMQGLLKNKHSGIIVNEIVGDDLSLIPCLSIFFGVVSFA